MLHRPGAAELAALPSLAEHPAYGELKVQSPHAGGVRYWLAHRTAVTIEQLVNGDWIRVHAYSADATDASDDDIPVVATLTPVYRDDRHPRPWTVTESRHALGELVGVEHHRFHSEEDAHAFARATGAGVSS